MLGNKITDAKDINNVCYNFLSRYQYGANDMKCSLCSKAISDYNYNWLNGKICCGPCYSSHKPQASKTNRRVTKRDNFSRESMIVLMRFENEVDATVCRDLLYTKGVTAEIRGHTNMAIAPNGSEYAVSDMQLLVPQAQFQYCREIIRTEQVIGGEEIAVTLLVKSDFSYLWIIFFVAVVLPVGVWIYPYSLSPLTTLLIFTLMPLIGFFIGQKRSVYICTNHQCNEVNNKKATRCKGCGREIKGVVNSRAEITAFQEKQKTVKTL